MYKRTIEAVRRGECGGAWLVLGKGGRGLPCGLDWGRGGEWGGTPCAGKDPGSEGSARQGSLSTFEADWGPGQVLSLESGRWGAWEDPAPSAAGRWREALLPRPCSSKSRWSLPVLSSSRVPVCTRCSIKASRMRECCLCSWPPQNFTEAGLKIGHLVGGEASEATFALAPRCRSVWFRGTDLRV